MCWIVLVLDRLVRRLHFDWLAVIIYVKFAVEDVLKENNYYNNVTNIKVYIVYHTLYISLRDTYLSKRWLIHVVWIVSNFKHGIFSFLDQIEICILGNPIDIYNVHIALYWKTFCHISTSKFCKNLDCCR